MRLNKKGFTLIELLGTITIIAILAAFVIPNVFELLDKGKKKNYEILQNNVLVAAENYTTECSAKGKLYKVYIAPANTTVGDVLTLYQSINNELTIETICKTNLITSSACSNSTAITEGKQIIIPFTCTKIKTETILTSLDLAQNGFLKASTNEIGNKVIPRSTDDLDVSTCLKVKIKYEESTYSYDYEIIDECD